MQKIRLLIPFVVGTLALAGGVYVGQAVAATHLTLLAQYHKFLNRYADQNSNNMSAVITGSVEDIYPEDSSIVLRVPSLYETKGFMMRVDLRQALKNRPPYTEDTRAAFEALALIKGDILDVEIPRQKEGLFEAQSIVKNIKWE